MRRLALSALLAVFAVPLAARAQEAPAPISTGLTASVSLGGGAELGLEEGADAGILEVEAVVGWEIESLGLRPELALALGVQPDGHIGFRPGVRWSVPGIPIQLRVALDASNVRDSDLHWRWLLLGAAAEVRFTSLLGLYGEIDLGAPLRSEAGLPLLVRGGASFRF